MISCDIAVVRVGITTDSLSPEGSYAADERDADLFSDTSSITGRSALGSVSSSVASKSSG